MMVVFFFKRPLLSYSYLLLPWVSIWSPSLKVETRPEIADTLTTVYLTSPLPSGAKGITTRRRVKPQGDFQIKPPYHVNQT